MNAQTVIEILNLNSKIRFGLGEEECGIENIIEYIAGTCCEDKSYCGNITIEMAANQTLSYEVVNIEDVPHLAVTISEGNTINIPLSDIGDQWGDQVVIATSGLTGNGTASNPLRLAELIQNRVTTCHVAIQEINLKQRAYIPQLPYRGDVKYVVPPELNGYTIVGITVKDGSSEAGILKNNTTAIIGQTTVTTGDLLSLYVTSVGQELTATITLKGSL